MTEISMILSWVSKLIIVILGANIWSISSSFSTITEIRKSALYSWGCLNYQVRLSCNHPSPGNQIHELSRNFHCYVLLLNVINIRKISLYSLTFSSTTQKDSLIFWSFSKVQKCFCTFFNTEFHGLFTILILDYQGDDNL